MSHHDNSKQYPTLAPGPPRSFAPQSAVAVSRPKKNSTACLACKSAKRKCSGPPAPCKACSSAGAESDCQFDPSRDLRRKVAVKRTIQELADYKDLLESLLTAIRSAHPDKLHELTDLIRTNASMKDIAVAVGSPVTNFTDSKTLSTTSRLTLSDDGDAEQLDIKSTAPSDIDHIPTSPEEHLTETSRAAVHPYARVTLESLCDIPLFNVPARPWTEVSDDSDLVSNLVSLYFTWDHPCGQVVDQGIFLDHMKRRDLDSEFCTPLLVNSLLSMASVYSDSPDVFSNPENMFSRGQSFFQEAEKLWIAQAGRPNLPNIQALLLMCNVVSCQGDAARGWYLLRQAVQLGEELGLFMHPRGARLRSIGDETSERERVRAITAWGVFSLNLQMSIKLQKDPNLAPPVFRMQLCGDCDFDWTPYPRLGKITYITKPAHLPQVREGLAELTNIMVHVQGLFYGESLTRSFEALLPKAEDLYNRLRRWLADWPGRSQVGKEPIPQLLILRITCVQAIMALLEMLMERDQQNTVAPKLRQTWCQQAKEMAQCLRIFRQWYGLKHIPSQVVDAISRGMRVLVHQLDNDEAKHAFIEFCRFAMALSQRFKPSAGTVHAIQSLAQRGVVRLPTEAIAILDGCEPRRYQES